MKKRIMKLALLSISLSLFSCTSNENNPSVSSNETLKSEETSSVNEPVSEETSSSKESVSEENSSSEEKPTAWSESDLQKMSTYLNGYTCLPFPIGFTSSYVEASGTDEEGESFIVYDYKSGDLSESYGQQLVSASFVFDGKETENGDDYYCYHYSIANTNDQIMVQIDYYQDAFEIFAWYEEGTPIYETFPYEVIASFFNLSKVDETILPSFALAENKKYDAYPSGETYFLVGGYYDTSIEENTYIANYETSLTAAGYVVNKEKGYAVSEKNLLKVEYMATEGYFSIQISKYAPILPGENSLSFLPSDFPASYADMEIMKNNVSFKISFVSNDNKGIIQFRNANKGSGYLYNVDSLGRLSSITVTENDVNSHQYYGVLSCYVSSSVISETNVGVAVTPTYTNGVYTYPIPEGNSYFKLIDETKYASKNASITINYVVKG